MSPSLLIACLALTVPINLAMNGLWLWIAVRIAGAAKAGYVRSTVVALAISVALFLAATLALALHPALALLTIPAAIALSLWLIRRVFAFSRWRSAGVLAGMLALLATANLSLALAMRTFWLASFVVSSWSMEPTLKIEDRFLADRTLGPQRWDLLVFHPADAPKQSWVKRLVGLPGETVALRGGAVLINGSEVALPAVYSGRRFDAMDRDTRMPHRGTADGPITLGPDEFFVLGNNIEASLDSRNWTQDYGPNVHAGAVPRSALVGVARGIYAPLEHAQLFR